MSPVFKGWVYSQRHAWKGLLRRFVFMNFNKCHTCRSSQRQPRTGLLRRFELMNFDVCHSCRSSQRHAWKGLLRRFVFMNFDVCNLYRSSQRHPLTGLLRRFVFINFNKCHTCRSWQRHAWKGLLRRYVLMNFDVCHICRSSQRSDFLHDASAGRRIGPLAQPVIVPRYHCSPDMQVLEDVPEIITATNTFEVLTHDTAQTDHVWILSRMWRSEFTNNT